MNNSNFTGYPDMTKSYNIYPLPTSIPNAFYAPSDGIILGGLGLGDTIGYVTIDNVGGIICGRGMGSYNNGCWFYLPTKKGDRLDFANSSFWFGNSLYFAPYKQR